MPTLFRRVNSVVVDPNFSKINDAYVDPTFAASNTAAEGGGSLGSSAAVPYGTLFPLASTGGAYRGMPIGRSAATGKLVPISASGAIPEGVLAFDITPYVVARGAKIAVVKAGRIRSYAGGALNVGDPVKYDTSANFGGFVKWVAGTDAQVLFKGYAYPILDGSDGNTPGLSAVQGDTIFVDLQNQ